VTFFRKRTEELMALQGLNDTTVVIYGDNNNWFAARLLANENLRAAKTCV
jgi:3-mercaptopyruvate sulfurtransferase SseA